MIYFNNSQDIPPIGYPEAEFWISDSQRDRCSKTVRVGEICCVLHKDENGYFIRRFKIHELKREKGESYIFANPAEVKQHHVPSKAALADDTFGKAFLTVEGNLKRGSMF